MVEYDLIHNHAHIFRRIFLVTQILLEHFTFQCSPSIKKNILISRMFSQYKETSATMHKKFYPVFVS